ncbi:MAG: tRNA (uridine(34)/cytosine(34)/5-carboxymethylaminomethyluridine(34)-2'-O)-methyltransferase TrmL [Clostridia bacterium]|nr:tRNA (uridine(34)/cytosine(34)/5-carboxymethylaminomethyluridine(34)-2'-O)-methyltransferase TrmL [Clostridia bacterium]
MNNINIALIEPEIPQNTGNIARTCAAIGASLHLVEPMGFTVDDKKLKRAGLDYWHQLDITYYPSLEDFLKKTENENLFFFTTKAKNCYSEVKYPKRVFLVFGKETKGLPEALLHDNPEKCVRLPMRENLRSLNLSNTAAVAAFEVLRQRNFEGLQTEGRLTRFEW